MSEIGNLIYNRRKELGLTLEEVGKAVGVSKSTVKKWENGFISNMRRDKIEKLATILQVSPVRLLGIETKAKPLTVSEIRMSTVPVPLVGRVAAGLSCHAEDNIEGYILTDSEILHEGYDYFWLTVTGDSMEPELHDGDRVLVREQETLDSECIAVVRIDGEDGVVKKVRIDRDKITLTSVNPYYPPRIFEREEMNNIAVVGKVVQSQRIY